MLVHSIQMYQDSAVQVISELLTEHEDRVNMYGLCVQQLTILIKACPSCTVFRWSGKYYETRGLAMGHRLAPVLAIAFMSKVEAHSPEYPTFALL